MLGAAAAWLGIFAPGVLMMFALLPWWSVFRRWPLYRRCAGQAPYEWSGTVAGRTWRAGCRCETARGNIVSGATLDHRRAACMTVCPLELRGSRRL